LRGSRSDVVPVVIERHFESCMVTVSFVVQIV